MVWSKNLRRFSLLLATLIVFAGLQVIPEAHGATTVGVPGATPVPGDPLTGSGQVNRTLLTYSDLTTTQTPSAPVDNSAFAIPANAAMPTTTFEGTLTLNNVTSSGGFQNIPTSNSSYTVNCAAVCGQHLPPFSMDFVQNGSYLIPSNQNLIITNDQQLLPPKPSLSGTALGLYYQGTWNLFVEPGRCWSEASDSGSASSFSRCSVPFTLAEFSDIGHTSYGLITFLYSSTSISNVRYQVVSETDASNQFNMWGQLSATYSPHKVTNDLAIANLESKTVQNRIPEKPISALATDYPNSGIDVSVFFSGRTADQKTIPPSSVTAYGVFYKGINYVGGCDTRFGMYPYCNEMRITLNSGAKSVLPGLALALLVKLYGASVLNAKLSDYIPEMSTSSIWKNSNVTFRDAANMASGVYLTDSRFVYPFGDGSAGICFSCLVDYKSRLQASLDVGTPHPSESGLSFAYMNTLMFLLTQAETGYIQSKIGPSADLFNLMVKDVYEPAGIGPGIDTSRTDNVSVQTSSPTISGRPMGQGIVYANIDDIVKLSILFQNNGEINGVQLVDRSSMLSAMQRLTSDTGVNAVTQNYGGPTVSQGTPNGDGDNTVGGGGVRYSRAVWSYPNAFDIPNCAFQVTSFRGHGGVTIQMLPNGATYYMINESETVIFDPAFIQLNKLSPMCAPTSTNVLSSYSTIGLGQPVTLKASVSSATRSWAPTGTVQFFMNDKSISPNILLDDKGSATFIVSSLPLGNQSITATYSPDVTYYEGYSASPAISSLSSACSGTATNCEIQSTSGMKVGDNIVMCSKNGVCDVHVVSSLTATSISWIGAYQSAAHASGEPVWVQNTAGGGFSASTSSEYIQTVQSAAVATTTTTTSTLPIPSTTTTLKKQPLLTITCVKGKLTKRVTAVKPVCPAGYRKK
jgi:CubicO group peptidase (beta-lactamase class C family)